MPTVLRQWDKLLDGREITTYSNLTPVQQAPDRRKKRIKTKELKICIDEFLAAEFQRKHAGLISESTYDTKQRRLTKWMLLYLLDKGCSHSQHIQTDTFKEYPVWRKAAKSTRKLELVNIKDFILNYLSPRKLIRDDIDFNKIVPKIKVLDSELDGNPPLDEANWRKVLVALRENCKQTERNPNHRGHTSIGCFIIE